MADDNDGGRIGKIGIPLRHTRVEIQRKDVTNSFIQVFGLVQHRLAVEGRKVLIEVHREEVKALDARFQDRFVVLKNIMEIVCCFGGDRSDLLIAPGIARDEEDGYTLKLFAESERFPAYSKLVEIFVKDYLGMIINSLLPI